MTGGQFQQIFAQWAGEGAEPEPTWIPPEWIGPPSDELGESVSLAVVVARSERAVVAIRQATAYSTGVILEVVAHARWLSERDAHNLMHEQHVFPDESERSAGFLRVGVELADGGRASNLGTHRPTDGQQPPKMPVLMQTGGGGGSAGEGRVVLDNRYWLWPLPPPGVLRAYVEWPALDIALSSVDLDAGELRATASRSLALWDQP